MQIQKAQNCVFFYFGGEIMSGIYNDRNGKHPVISGGVGTVVLKDAPGVLHRIVIPGTFLGTIQFDDASASTGTVAASQIFAFGNPTYTTYPQAFEFGVAFRHGLVYRSTGTPTVTVVWE